MLATNHKPPRLTRIVGRLIHSTAGALRNRAELLSVEWQVEKIRLMELLVWIIGVVSLAFSGAILLTAAVIFLFPPRYRVIVAVVFALVYLSGALASWYALKRSLKREPFEESLAQAKKDVAWLESLR